MKRKAVFRNSQQNQMSMFPEDLGTWIPADHPVRVVNQVIEQVNLKRLYDSYKGGGSSSYDPKMMIKVLIYAYLDNTYSSRKIEKALKESIPFIWLSGRSTPDHSTISIFRSKRLQGFEGEMFKDIFTDIVLLLAEAGLVDLQDVYTDGTKLEANANRYTYVWAKRLSSSKEKIRERLEGFWAYLEGLYKAEEQEVEPLKLGKKASSEKIQETVDRINQLVSDKEIKAKIAKEEKKNLRAINKFADRYKRYEDQEVIIDGRGSYSKTDHDATFMQTKDDHLKNGQLKANYNIQFSTSNRVITHYSVERTSSDMATYIRHLEGFKERYNFYPKQVTADAGYGSEENYLFLEEKGIEGFVKYGSFYREHRRNFKTKEFANARNLHYDEKGDFYICPVGKKINRIGETKKTLRSGYIKETNIYEAADCKGCALMEPCLKQNSNKKISTNRRIHRTPNLERLRAKARKLLLSEEGIRKRKQRSVDVEGCFGELKQNKGFRRLMLRGLKKVNIEVGLLAMSMNIAKLAKHKARTMDEVCPKTSKTTLFNRSNKSIAAKRG